MSGNLILSLIPISSELSSIQVDTDILGEIAAVPRINFEDVADEAFLDVLSALAERTGQVSDYIFAVLLSEHLVEQSSGLFVVVIWVLVRVSSNSSGQSLLWNCVWFVLLWCPVVTVRFVVRVATTVAINCHLTIPSVVVAHGGAVGTVDRNLFVILSESVAVCVWVVQESALKHLIIAGFNAGNQVRGSKRNLFCLSKVVGWVSV